MAVGSGQTLCDARGAWLPLRPLNWGLGIVLVSLQTVKDALVDIFALDILCNRVERHQLLLGKAVHEKISQSDKGSLLDVVWLVGLSMVAWPQTPNLLVYLFRRDGLALLLQRGHDIRDLDGV